MSNAHKGHARHYKHIEWYIQTAALPVKTGIVILLWGEALRPPLFFIQVTFAIHFSACIYIYIYDFLHVALPVKTSIVILLCPPRFCIQVTLAIHLSACVCIYIYIYTRMFLRCHSALGGGAAPSPQSPLPLLYSSHTCNTLLCM